MAVIRDTTEDDWHLLRGIRLRALRESPRAFMSEHDREARRGERQWRTLLRGDLWLLAFADGTAAEPVGVIAASREPPGGEPFISALWVDPGHRRQGIASGLIQAALDRAVARGARAVSLWVLDGNDVARACYLAAGFAGTGKSQRVPGSSGTREWRMRRRIG